MPVRRKIQGRIFRFPRCEGMDAAGRATQDAKAETRIEIGCVKTGIYREISN